MDMQDQIHEIHIWDLPGWENFIVKLNRAFRENLFTAIKDKVGGYANILKKYGAICRAINLGYANGHAFYDRLKNGGYIRLGPLIHIAAQVGVAKHEIEGNIVAYKCENSGEEIFDPKLPIERGPIFDAILAHHIFDGSVSSGDRGTYRQKNIIAAKSFMRKVEFLIGRIERRSKDPYSFYIPRFLVRLFKRSYDYGFDTYSARAPTDIVNGSWASKMAFLAAAVMDEGTIEDTKIRIYLANRRLLQDVRDIAVNLGFNCSEVLEYKNRQLFCLSIKPLEKFYSDMLILAQKYPPFDLAHHKSMLDFHIRRKGLFFGRRKSGETKKRIIEELRKGPRTCKELMLGLVVGRNRVYKHLKDLRILGLVEKSNKRGNAYLWQLSERVQNLKDVDNLINAFAKASFRRRRERSIERILGGLTEGLDDTQLLSKKLGLHRSTINEHLRELARRGLVSKVGKRTRGFANLDVWEITLFSTFEAKVA